MPEEIEENPNIGELIKTILQIVILICVIWFCYKIFTPSEKLSCGTDTECWNNVTSEFIQKMEDDLNDGVLDDEYYWEYKEITDKVEKIADEEIRYIINKNLKDRLSEIESSKQQVIIKELRLQWG